MFTLEKEKNVDFLQIEYMQQQQSHTTLSMI